MYKYLVAFALVTPLVGIWLVEGGEYAGSVGVDGYPNGATAAFATYAAAVAVIAWLCSGRRNRLVTAPLAEANTPFRRFSNNLMLFNGVFLVVFLFGFGAISVWLGAVSKGEFRVSLGWFGAIPNLMSKFIVPALVAYAAMLYSRSSRTFEMKVRLALVFLLAFAIGASWGFKSTAMSALLPALLLLYWRVRPVALLMLAAIFVGTLMLFFQIFDTHNDVGVDMQTYLLTRVTVLQGDVAWYVWGLYTSGEPFPNYWPTWLALVGDKLLGILGVSRTDPYEWMLHHYDWMINYLADVPLETTEEGHSVVATPFAEGLIAGGIGGLALFTTIAGVLIGSMYRLIDRALRSGHDIQAAIGATYFCYHLLPWAISGAIVQLFHISLLISLGTTLLALVVMRRFSLQQFLNPPSRRRRSVAPQPQPAVTAEQDGVFARPPLTGSSRQVRTR